MVMQNIVNYQAPFIDLNGKPVSAGRVHFVDSGVSSVPSGSSSPDYITVYDKDGTELSNPLSLNDNGQFDIQPFAEDGIDFRMIVERPTGIPPQILDDSMCWEQVCIIDVKSQHIEVTYTGVNSVSGLSELRNTDPSIGTVVVVGYSESGDFCPPRIFQWVDELKDENYGTHVRSSVSGHESDGTWVCEPSGFLDVRWFGVNPSASDNSIAINRANDNYPSTALYFPAGEYTLANTVNLNSVILERLANFKTNNGSGVQFKCTFLENRGGKFKSQGSGKVVVPIVHGLFRTSWTDSNGKLDEFLNENSLQYIEEIVFDESRSVSSGSSISIENKIVSVMKGVSTPSVISFVDCVINRLANGTIDANHIVGKTDVVTPQVKHPNYGTEEYNQFKLDDSGLSIRSTFTIGGTYTPKSASIYKDTDGFRISLKYGSFDRIEVEELVAEGVSVGANGIVTSMIVANSTASFRGQSYFHNGIKGNGNNKPVEVPNGTFRNFTKSSVYNWGNGQTPNYFWPADSGFDLLRAKVHHFSSIAHSITLFLPQDQSLRVDGTIICVENLGLVDENTSFNDQPKVDISDTGCIVCSNADDSKPVGVVAPYTHKYFIFRNNKWSECY